MLIIGWQTKPKKLDQGLFFCPGCQDARAYERKRLYVYFSFFFIPLFRMAPGSPPYVQCVGCNGAFPEEVLELLPEGAMAARTAKTGHDADTKKAPPRKLQGERVLAKRDSFWYPASVCAHDAHGIDVKYDDGSRATLAEDMVMALDLQIGDPIQVRREGDRYDPAIIQDFDGKTLRVQYDDGTQGRAVMRAVRVDWGDSRIANQKFHGQIQWMRPHCGHSEP